MQSIKTKKQAAAITGGLSNPDKMPCKSYNLPARECRVGSILRGIKNSTCAGCYALKGRYAFPNVQAALYRRLESLNNPDWVPAMVRLIDNEPFFRWFDSGDIQSVDHLAQIVAVCNATPKTKHWLPTREVKLVREYARNNPIPKNLNIRISAPMIDAESPRVIDSAGKALPTSTVHDKRPPIGYECPAPKQGNNCGDCRACWNPRKRNISYGKH